MPLLEVLLGPPSSRRRVVVESAETEQAECGGVVVPQHRDRETWAQPVEALVRGRAVAHEVPETGDLRELQRVHVREDGVERLQVGVDV